MPIKDHKYVGIIAGKSNLGTVTKSRAATPAFKQIIQNIQLGFVLAMLTISRCFRYQLKARHINRSTDSYGKISFIPDLHCQESNRVNDLPGDAKKWGSLGFDRGTKFATGYSALVPKSLESIIDLERAKNIPPEELSAVWNEYHIGRGHISTVLTSKQYYLLAERTSSCLYFVIPLWKGAGYTTMFVQAKMPHIIFTGLEDYKARGTQASPYITVTYYKEFVESKGLVLVRGDIVFTSKLTDEEAGKLLENLQSFYLNDSRYKLVEQFNREPSEFEFKDVLRMLEMPLG